MKVKVKIDILLSKGVVSVVVGESTNFEFRISKVKIGILLSKVLPDFSKPGGSEN